MHAGLSSQYSSSQTKYSWGCCKRVKGEGISYFFTARFLNATFRGMCMYTSAAPDTPDRILFSGFISYVICACFVGF